MQKNTYTPHLSFHQMMIILLNFLYIHSSGEASSYIPNLRSSSHEIPLYLWIIRWDYPIILQQEPLFEC